MILFFTGIVALILGYFIYGKWIEKIIAPTDEPTPAIRLKDNVDFMVLPHWKNMLIQLLNIAGVGPVIGAILGIVFGPIVFIIIPIGNIFAGAAHDYFSGMMSIRAGGANLPQLVRTHLGNGYGYFFSIFMAALLLLVVAVFINIPANLIDQMVPEAHIFYLAVGIIFIYYICATLFPIDKIIGAIYPYFGATLIISSVAIFFSLVYQGFLSPEILTVTPTFKLTDKPIIPVLFVTIACGIISGFHATQSPIIARTIQHEKQGRQAFYGMMIVEGIIAMIWAAVGMSIYNLFPELQSQGATQTLSKAADFFLGSALGDFAVIGVIFLAITSGDTAMRSLRLAIAEQIKLPQIKMRHRLFITIPVILVITALLIWSNQSKDSFNQLWNYFSWGNQVLAASTLLTATIWLRKNKKIPYIALIPGAFMTFIVLSYILWISPENGGPIGLGLNYTFSLILAAVLTLIISMLVLFKKVTK